VSSKHTDYSIKVLDMKSSLSSKNAPSKVVLLQDLKSHRAQVIAHEIYLDKVMISVDLDGLICLWNYTSKTPLKIIKTLDTQISAFDLLSTKKGFSIGTQTGKIFCYDLLKEGLNLELDPTVTIQENFAIQILRSFN
jgi:hypothetical protein